MLYPCIHADQEDETPVKNLKKPACAPKSQTKTKKTALKQNEKEPKTKKPKTSKDASTVTPRSKASKRSAQTPQEDAPKKPKAGAKTAAKSKAKAKGAETTTPEAEPLPTPAAALTGDMPGNSANLKPTRVRKPPVSAEPVEAVTSLDTPAVEKTTGNLSPAESLPARKPAVAPTAPTVSRGDVSHDDPGSQSQWQLGCI